MKFKISFLRLSAVLFVALMSLPVFSVSHSPVVLFYSELSDVRFYLNDEEIGMLPVTFTSLVPGKYEIRAEKENYKTLVQTIVVTNESNQEFKIDLEIAKGILIFNVEPLPESINANGVKHKLEESQNSIELTAGVYKISLEKFGFEKLETTVSIQPYQEVTVEGKFKAKEFAVSNIKTYPKTINTESKSFRKKCVISFDVTTNGKCSFTVVDENKNTVRILEAGNFDREHQKILWDGCDSEGKTVPDGTYFLLENEKCRITVKSDDKVEFSGIGKTGSSFATSPIATMSEKGLFKLSSQSLFDYSKEEGSGIFGFPLEFYFLYSPLDFFEFSFHFGTSILYSDEIQAPFFFGSSVKFGKNWDNLSLSGVLAYTYQTKEQSYLMQNNGLEGGVLFDYFVENWLFSFSSFAVLFPQTGIPVISENANFADENLLWKNCASASYIWQRTQLTFYFQYNYLTQYKFGAYSTLTLTDSHIQLFLYTEFQFDQLDFVGNYNRLGLNILI
ncbi:MAG: PEGA domain-containing protein [Treponemataceae bacterium]|nr:PEGA domain-containing protein [Treponemataceae bacterium]